MTGEARFRVRRGARLPRACRAARMRRAAPYIVPNQSACRGAFHRQR